MAPNPSGSSAGERGYHGGGGANGKGQVVAAKMPGTPRRETGGHRQEKAVQDPGLKDYVSRFFFLSLPISRSFAGKVPLFPPSTSYIFQVVMLVGSIYTPLAVGVHNGGCGQ